MSLLFTPAKIGTLDLPNPLVRSATAERLADPTGRPMPQLQQIYETLVIGGVGLIITGHLYIHPSGKAHPEMAGIYADELIPHLAALTDAVHREGGRIVAQINHGGIHCSDSDFISLCRPLICEPDLSNRLRWGLQERARCISGDRCWPKVTGEGITCKCLND